MAAVRGFRALVNDRHVRDVALQGAVVVGLAVLLWFFVRNASENMVKAGIATGFGFLTATAGIDLNFKLIEYGAGSSYAQMLLVGVLNTLLVTALGIVLASVLGFALGIARLSRNWLLSSLAGAFIELARNIPLLLFVFVWYFGIIAALPVPRSSLGLFDLVFLNNRGLYVPVPEEGRALLAIPLAMAVGLAAFLALRHWATARQARTGAAFPLPAVALLLLVGLPAAVACAVGLSVAWDVPALRGFNFRGGTVLTPELVALVAALATYTAAFIAEIVRGGILAVGEGQRQAAQALGLRPGQVLRLVVIPQALRVIVPPLTSQYLNLAKNSSFGAAIAFPEIFSVFAGSALNQTGQAIEIIAMTLAIYLAISLAVSAFMNWYNHRVALVTR